MREPDAAFADPRQAVLYDEFDHDRSDLDHYVAIAEEVNARHIIDVGCALAPWRSDWPAAACPSSAWIPRKRPST